MNDFIRHIESRADRGPHADPRDVVTRALVAEHGAESQRRGKPTWVLAAASVAIVVAGSAAFVAAGRSSQPADSDSGVLPAVDKPTVNSVLAADDRIIVPTACPAVTYRFEDPPAGFNPISPTGTSAESQMFFEITNDVSLNRGVTPWLVTAPAGRGDEIVDVTIQGFPTRVGAGLGPGGLGPQIGFVFPADADATHPCNQWMLQSLDGELAAAEFAELASALRLVGDGEVRQSLSGLTPSDVIIPTVVPEGWTIEPVTVSDLADGDVESRQTLAYFQFSDERQSAAGGVLIMGGMQPAEIDGAPVTAAGVDWVSYENSGETVFQVFVGTNLVSVSAPGFDSDALLDFLDGLRSGPGADFPAGVFNRDSGGLAVARDSATETTLNVRFVGDLWCWAVRTAERTIGNDCSNFPTGSGAQSAFNPDVILLQVSQAKGASAPLDDMTTDFHVAGIVDATVDSVDIEFSNGSIFTIEATDLSDVFAEHYFVAVLSLPGEPGSNEIVAIRTTAG